jgi:large subunit ribosomal protein L10
MPAQWKLNEVETLRDIVTSHSVVGIVGFRGIPAPQMQEMRALLRDDAVLRIAKCSLIIRALENGIVTLQEFVDGEVGVIAADINPFKLYRQLEQLNMRAPAKGGEEALADIVIEKGPTQFNPGPIVGELQKVGIPAAIREGKVKIEKTVTVVRKGERIPVELARMLNRLGVKPIEIGLSVRALYEDGIVFRPDVLAIDLDGFAADMQQAASRAFTLAVEIAYPTPLTVEAIIQKAYRTARTMAIECDVYTKDTIEEFIRRAYLHAQTLEQTIGG